MGYLTSCVLWLDSLVGWVVLQIVSLLRWGCCRGPEAGKALVLEARQAMVLALQMVKAAG